MRNSEPRAGKCPLKAAMVVLAAVAGQHSTWLGCYLYRDGCVPSLWPGSLWRDVLNISLTSNMPPKVLRTLVPLHTGVTPNLIPCRSGISFLPLRSFDVRESDFVVPDLVSACAPSTVTRCVPITQGTGVCSYLTALLPTT